MRRTLCCHESFKENYHRVQLPRRILLARHIRKEEQRLPRASSNTLPDVSSAVHNNRPALREKAKDIPYKYNRWWVTNEHEFVHQYAFIEDPEVTRERRRLLDSRATAEELWRKPHAPVFLPFTPHVPAVDTTKDPDAAFLKPTNLPKWKDYIVRENPVVPRTWY